MLFLVARGAPPGLFLVARGARPGLFLVARGAWRASGTISSGAWRASGTISSGAWRASGTISSGAWRASGTISSGAWRASGTIPSGAWRVANESQLLPYAPGIERGLELDGRPPDHLNSPPTPRCGRGPPGANYKAIVILALCCHVLQGNLNTPCNKAWPVLEEPGMGVSAPLRGGLAAPPNPLPSKPLGGLRPHHPPKARLTGWEASSHCWEPLL